LKSNDYHFVTHWRFQATAEEVYALTANPGDYTRWWPSVYLEATLLAEGDPQGIGRRFQFHTKGWLPYTLQWESCAIEKEPPRRLVIRATGDFDGCGIWTCNEDGDSVEVEFDWKLTADKPLIRYLSFLFKPVFAANHRWAMAQGEKGLAGQLTRHQARLL